MAVTRNSASGSRPAEARPADSPPPELLVAGAFAVDAAHKLAGAGGGLSAFRATDRRAGGRAGLMAVQVRPDAPARANALARLASQTIGGVLTPLAYGPAQGPGGALAPFVICQAPPGPALSAVGTPPPKPWSEADLLDLLLRPAAAALLGLHERNVTHRAIRPDNLFRAGPRDVVTLGARLGGPARQPAAGDI